MRCSRCGSAMAQTHAESGTSSKQAWYKCAMCGRSQLVSAPVGGRLVGPMLIEATPRLRSRLFSAA